jgi:hypothetical protein
MIPMFRGIENNCTGKMLLSRMRRFVKEGLVVCATVIDGAKKDPQRENDGEILEHPHATPLAAENETGAERRV